MMDEEQPDCGGNRHYDYISVEQHDAAEKSLETKERWCDLTTAEVVVLRAQMKGFGIDPDIVDNRDRLAVIRCLLYHLKYERKEIP